MTPAEAQLAEAAARQVSRVPFEDNGFGLCPHCNCAGHYVNVHRAQWFFCAVCRTRWRAGENLFSSWRDELTAGGAKELWAANAAMLELCENVEPVIPPSPPSPPPAEEEHGTR